MQVVIYYSKT